MNETSDNDNDKGDEELDDEAVHKGNLISKFDKIVAKVGKIVKIFSMFSIKSNENYEPCNINSIGKEKHL